VCAAPLSWGRHPQTFTEAVIRQLTRFSVFSHQFELETPFLPKPNRRSKSG
jgi:hypothetical protein